MNGTGYIEITDELLDEFINLCVVPVLRRDIVVRNADLRDALQEYLYRFEGRGDWAFTNFDARRLYDRIQAKYGGVIENLESPAQHVGMVLLTVPERDETN